MVGYFKNAPKEVLLTGILTFDEWYDLFIGMFNRKPVDAEKNTIRHLIIEARKQELTKARGAVEGAGLTEGELDAITEEVDKHYENPIGDRYKAISEAQTKAILKALGGE